MPPAPRGRSPPRSRGRAYAARPYADHRDLAPLIEQERHRLPLRQGARARDVRLGLDLPHARSEDLERTLAVGRPPVNTPSFPLGASASAHARKRGPRSSICHSPNAQTIASHGPPPVSAASLRPPRRWRTRPSSPAPGRSAPSPRSCRSPAPSPSPTALATASTSIPARRWRRGPAPQAGARAPATRSR